ncbi:MAG: response regulator [Bacteroidota bacterium]
MEEAGFQVINCPDGETAWEYYQKMDPDLCILDVNMPYRDGYSAWPKRSGKKAI